MRLPSRFLPHAILAVSLGCLPGCVDLIREAASSSKRSSGASAKSEPTPASKEPNTPKKPKIAVVAAPYQHRILFANKSLELDASNASIAIDTWTLGDPLYIHAYGPSPKRSVLYAEVNGEPAVGAGVEIVPNSEAGALGYVDLDGDGDIMPVQGDLGPKLLDEHIGKRAAQYAGVWSNINSTPHWARIWQEFHKRIIPMLHVGDNTLKLTLANEKHTETFAEGAVTIKVPSEAAWKADLAENVEKPASGDPATLREIEKLVRAAPPFRGKQIVRVSYFLDQWKKEYKRQELIRATMYVDVTYRESGDKFPARCRVTGVTAVREAENGPEPKLGKVFLGDRTIETRWTPCP